MAEKDPPRPIAEKPQPAPPMPVHLPVGDAGTPRSGPLPGGDGTEPVDPTLPPSPGNDPNP